MISVIRSAIVNDDVLLSLVLWIVFISRYNYVMQGVQGVVLDEGGGSGGVVTGRGRGGAENSQFHITR